MYVPAGRRWRWHVADSIRADKEVHKAPPLDLVGWFTICPLSGPQPQHLPIHRQLLDQHNESSIFLAFHPDTIADGTSQGGKLPFTIYESIYEAASDEDKHMHESDESQKLALRFKELPYTIETGEAEMIAVDFVAKGGANAASRQAASWPSKEESDGKGKKRSAPDGEVKTNANGVVEQDYLRPEDDDQIASLTGKANAIRMLQKRLTLIKKYLQSVPPCYLNDASQATMEPNPHIQHSVLRSIAALLARLPLLTPSTPAANDPTPGALAYGRESAAEASDVALISLLASLGDTLSIAKRMGAKASVLEAGKHTRGQEKFSNSFSSSFSSRNALDASFATDDVDEGIDATMSY